MMTPPSRSWLYVGLPLAVIMASAMIARAFDSSWIAPGQPLSADKLKANLDELALAMTPVSAHYHASGTGLTTTAYTELTVTNLTNRDWDTDSAYDPAAGVFTCPRAGRYELKYQANLTDTSGSVFMISSKIYNGATLLSNRGDAVSGNSGWGGTSVFGTQQIVQCAAGDHLRITIEAQGALTTKANAPVEFFQVDRIGN